MKKIIKNIFIATGIFIFMQVAQAQNYLQVLPDTLNWVPVKDLPQGAQMAVLSGDPSKSEPFVLRIKFPVNYKIPLHHHPVSENDTVIKGTFYLTVADKNGKMQENMLPPGSYFELPANLSHSATTKDEEVIVQINGVGPFAIVKE